MSGPDEPADASRVGPGTRLGPYEVIAPLGSGGMGEVFLALDTRLRRHVAVKVLPAELSADRERLARLEREARAASALNHPNIVTVYDIGSSGSTSYIAMEFVEGKTLRELLLSGPLPVKRALEIASQAADGLAKAHTAGIVHRDLKPENLMVSKDGFVKILDFGLAKFAPRESDELSRMPTVTKAQTEEGTVLGTVGYMSPEQARGKAVDFRSDQFSFGAIFYEMVAGKRPFEGTAAADVMAAIIRDEPQPLSVAAPELPALAGWIIERCLAKDPAERYASTHDLARDLAMLRRRMSETTVSGGGRAVDVAPRISSGARTALLVGATAAVALALGIALAPLLRGPGRLARAQWERLSFRRGMIWSGRFSPDGQTAVYSAAWEGAPGRLYVTRPGTEDTRVLDLPPGKIVSVSSRGELAFLRDPKFIFFSNQPGTLARVMLEGGTSRDVLEDVHGADWSPDGTQLAVARRVKGRDRLEYPVGKVLYESEGVLGSVAVSRDGEWIAFFEYVFPGAAVVAVRSADGRRRVLSGSWSDSSVGLAWSTDSREVWFTATTLHISTFAPARLYAVTLEGRRREVVRVPGDLRLFDIAKDGRVMLARWDWSTGLKAFGPGLDAEREVSWFGHSWLTDVSPDGSSVLFTGSSVLITDQGASLLLRRLDLSPAVRLGENLGFEVGQISPDGKWVVASLASEENRLVLLPTGAGEVRKIQPPADRALWFPDGRRLLLRLRESTARARPAIYDVVAGTMQPVALPKAFEGGVSEQAVSPDGRRIAVLEEFGPARTLWLLELDGGPMRRVPGLFPEENLIGWSQDGEHLFFYRIGDVPARVFKVDLGSGKSELWKELKPEDLAGVVRIRPVCVAPDGRAWAYSYTRVLSELYVAEGLR